MDVELVTDVASEDENFGFDDISEDYLNYEGERCGICMDVVIDRGVLDCCQHWFCFACIDNWATIMSLCPLCQQEFQLITCVPVHDTVGGTQTDDETNPRDDDWFIEGKTNTLSFPSYYIDENAVACLDGDGCKIRSGSVEIGEDSDIDTSIACDSCDKWYHAFCVGFDPEGTCEGSWLCPGCTVNRGPQRSDGASVSRNNYQNGAGDYLAEPSFSGRVSVSVADDGETAVVISLVEGNQTSQQSGKTSAEFSKDMENKVLSSYNTEALPDYRNSFKTESCQQEAEIYLSRQNCHTALHLLPPSELKKYSDDAVERASTHSNNMTESGLALDLDMKNNNLSENHAAGSLEANNRSEDLLRGIRRTVNVDADGAEALSMKSMMPEVKQTTSGTTGAKRKHGDRRNAGLEEREAKLSQKKIKAQIDSQPTSPTDQASASFLHRSKTESSQSSLPDKSLSGMENDTPDIMDIVQETDRRALKQHGLRNASGMNPKERETAAGLRLKKIMRRTGDNKDSSVLVQELRKKIREAVRNKSSDEVGQKLFDPKLLDAFRAALAGSGAENRKPVLDIKAKRSLLQKGKVRESLTKKIYGTGGKRKRAWTRECEVEFWKHRCLKASKPEKIQALKSVLDVLRDDSNHMKKMPGDDQEAKGSILSRLYLADTSVFPRKNDIKPVSALNTVPTLEQKRESGSTERASKSQPNNQSDINLQKHNTLSEVVIPLSDSRETKNHPKDVKSEAASSDVQLKKHPKGAPPSGKDLPSKPESVKGDRRKWALELLARKTAAAGKNMQDKEEDNLILKGNYPFLAKLPKDMRPVLAPSQHNKIPTAVRQAQLYRLAEHFLKKANLSVVSQSAETELAVADAVNIEKDVANRSNSKLVYVNLCSQELSRRSEGKNSDRAIEANPCSTSVCPSVVASEETISSSSDPEVDEALKKAGLMSDSPPNSPSPPTDEVNNLVGSPENIDGPDNVIEVDSHPDLDIYGDFEYNLEDDDFIGASVLNTSKLELESPKIKMLFSSLKPEKPNGILDIGNHEVQREDDSLAGSSDLLEFENKPTTGGSTVETTIDEGIARKSSDDNDDELSLAECEELYGPDTEQLIEKYPEMVNKKLPSENVDSMSNHADKNSGQPGEDQANNLRASTEESNPPTSDVEKKENTDTKEKTSKCDDAKQSENRNMVMKKVETYIKEHIRPLCKSGVITVEQYRWAVGKTTEKVMKYHSKERNANFLIKEGDKVKKLAEQYVEASQQKTKA